MRMLGSLVVLTLLGTMPATAQEIGCGTPPGSERCPAWTASYDEASGADIGDAAAVAPDGETIYVAGTSAGTGTGNDMATVAWDARTGAQRWAARFASSGSDQAAAIAVSHEGDRVFSFGTSFGDLVTVAYDAATGDELWSSIHGGPGGDAAHAMGVGRDDGRVYVVGRVDNGPRSSGGTELDFATIAYEAATGRELWARYYDGPANFWEVPQDLGVGFEVVEVNGEEVVRDLVYVTGRSNGQSTANEHTDYATVAYEGDTGHERWVARYDAPAKNREYPYALAVSRDGTRVYVTGESVGSGTGNDYVTVGYDAHTGNEVWAHREARANDDRALGIAVSPTGQNVYVTGYGMNGGHPFDRSAATIAIDTVTGQRVWHARFDGPVGEVGDDTFVSPDGRTVYVGGLSAGLVFGGGVQGSGAAVGISGFLAIAYDAQTGSQTWAAHHGGIAADYAYRGGALSPDGTRLFLAGGGFGDYQVAAYDTGAAG